MRLTAAIVICAALCAGSARSGAWMREDGATFLSVETTLRHTPSGTIRETDLYLDYGLNERVSIGLTVFEAEGIRGHVTGFARIPVPINRGDAQMAVQLDVGAVYENRALNGLYRATYAYGRPFRWGDGYGWINLEAAYERRMARPSPTYKLDFTLGRSSGARIRPMFKLGAEHFAYQPLHWNASAHMLIGAKNGMTWNFGLERKDTGQRSTALKIGFWRDF